MSGRLEVGLFGPLAEKRSEGSAVWPLLVAAAEQAVASTEENDDVVSLSLQTNVPAQVNLATFLERAAKEVMKARSAGEDSDAAERYLRCACRLYLLSLHGCPPSPPSSAVAAGQHLLSACADVAVQRSSYMPTSEDAPFFRSITLYLGLCGVLSPTLGHAGVDRDGSEVEEEAARSIVRYFFCHQLAEEMEENEKSSIWNMFSSKAKAKRDGRVGEPLAVMGVMMARQSKGWGRSIIKEGLCQLLTAENEQERAKNSALTSAVLTQLFSKWEAEKAVCILLLFLYYIDDLSNLLSENNQWADVLVLLAANSEKKNRRTHRDEMNAGASSLCLFLLSIDAKLMKTLENTPFPTSRWPFQPQLAKHSTTAHALAVLSLRFLSSLSLSKLCLSHLSYLVAAATNVCECLARVVQPLPRHFLDLLSITTRRLRSACGSSGGKEMVSMWSELAGEVMAVMWRLCLRLRVDAACLLYDIVQRSDVVAEAVKVVAEATALQQPSTFLLSHEWSHRGSAGKEMVEWVEKVRAEIGEGEKGQVDIDHLHSVLLSSLPSSSPFSSSNADTPYIYEEEVQPELHFMPLLLPLSTLSEKVTAHYTAGCDMEEDTLAPTSNLRGSMQE